MICEIQVAGILRYHAAMKTTILALAAAVTFGAAPLARQSATGQAHHLDARGKHVMGFDQQKTSHHFLLFEDGGSIVVAVKDPKDATNLQAIRSHLHHISHSFADGRFDDPMVVHDRKDVPGIAEMARLKARIKYTYSETPAGGRVDIVTKDKDAIAAVHAFLAYQITDHQTGDSLTPAKRK
jgi:hypothetical protein